MTPLGAFLWPHDPMNRLPGRHRRPDQRRFQPSRADANIDTLLHSFVKPPIFGVFKLYNNRKTLLRITKQDEGVKFQGFHADHILVILDEAPGIPA